MPSLVFPEPAPAGHARFGLGVSVDVLPRRLVESEIREVPRMVGQTRVGVGADFFATARFAGNVLSNELSVSAGYAHRFGPIVAALHERVAFWLGYLGVEGFDTTAWGLMTMPGASIGAGDPNGFRFTATLEVFLVHAQHVRLPDATVERRRFLVAGGALTLTVEDRVGKSSLVYYGVTATLAQPDYQLWLAFSDSEQRRVYPTFFAGYGF